MSTLLTELFLRIAVYVAADDRKDRLLEWRDECRDVDRPALHALRFIRSAARSHPPFDANMHALPQPNISDVKSLHSLRRSLILFGIGLVFLSLLLTLDGLSSSDLLWMLRLALPLSVLIAASFTGCGQDVPWLRATRPGTALILVFLLIMPLVILALHAWSLLGVTWFTFALILMAWDTYWSVKRPLRRRGLLRR